MAHTDEITLIVSRLDSVDQRVSEFESRLSSIEQKVEFRLSTLDSKIDAFTIKHSYTHGMLKLYGLIFGSIITGTVGLAVTFLSKLL